jgi:glucokinase
MAETVQRYALLGDVGGTNIRLELVGVDTTRNAPIATIKKETLNVADFNVFQNAIEKFLEDVTTYPEVAAIGIAGPIFDNTVSLANVQKWGTLSGEDLGIKLKIPYFRFINDFEAASYGILLVPEEDFVSINNIEPNPSKMRGVIGPGTGLGNSMLYPAVIKNHRETFVLPCEGGHTDFPTIDSETEEFFHFMVKETSEPAISV